MTAFRDLRDKLFGTFLTVGAVAVLVLPVVTFTAGCQSQLNVQQGDQALISSDVTRGTAEAIYPDHAPAVPDGQSVWKAENCASCHGATGQGGTAKIDFTNKQLMATKKPVDQYMFLLFGKQGVNHPILSDKITRQQAWNLTFYVRSLSRPLLADADRDSVKNVFGANCAVCHGTKGYGDGPLAKYAVIEPNPANFQNYQRFFDRSDQVLWDHIANGILWEGMPNFLGKEDKAKNVKFDEEYIWKLVSYVRNFHSTNQSTLAEAKVDGAPKPQTEVK